MRAVSTEECWFMLLSSSDHKSDICGFMCRRAFSGLEYNKKCQSFCRSCSDHAGTRAPDCSSGPFNLMRSLPPHPPIIQLGAVQRARGRGGHRKEQNGDRRKQIKMGMKREEQACVRWKKWDCTEKKDQRENKRLTRKEGGREGGKVWCYLCLPWHSSLPFFSLRAVLHWRSN